MGLEILANTTFRKMNLFPSSGEGKTLTLLGPLVRPNLNHWRTCVISQQLYKPIPGTFLRVAPGRGVSLATSAPSVSRMSIKMWQPRRLRNLWDTTACYRDSCTFFMVNGNAQITHLPKKTKLHGPNPRANYTDRATAACRRSDCQLLRIEGATWSS
jgi:hypothetical protein